MSEYKRRRNRKVGFLETLDGVDLSVKTDHGAKALQSIFQQGKLKHESVCIPHKTLWTPAVGSDFFHMGRETAATVGEAFTFGVNAGSLLDPLSHGTVSNFNRLNDGNAAIVVMADNAYGAGSPQLVSTTDGWDHVHCQWAKAKVKVRNDAVDDVYFGARVNFVRSRDSEGGDVDGDEMGYNEIPRDPTETMINWNREYAGCHMVRVPGLTSGNQNTGGRQTQATERTREFEIDIPVEALLKKNMRYTVGQDGIMRWRIQQSAVTSTVSAPQGFVLVRFFMLPCDPEVLSTSTDLTGLFICPTFNVLSFELEQCMLYLDKSEASVAS